MLLSEINKHHLDIRIKFQDKGHKYWIDDDDKDLISSTTFIKKFFKPFNVDDIVAKIVNSDKYHNDETYEYYNMEEKDIKNKWNISTELGTKLHMSIELFYNNIISEIKSTDYQYFINFNEDHKHLTIYRTEWLIFSEKHKITGSIDAVFINNDDSSLSLYDWKRTKEIKFIGFNNETAPEPLNHLQECNYSHYSLQLNLYRTIIERFYGFKVKEMFLVVFHPDNKNYKKIEIPRMEKEMNIILDIRLKEICKLEDDLSNKGKRWSTEEDLQLTTNAQKGINLINLSISHKRTPNAIKIRLMQKYIDNIDNIDEFCNIYNQFTKNDLIKFIEKKNKETPIIKLSHTGLSERQQYAYDLIMKGKNVFITSAAGGGKSYLIKMIRERLKNRKKIAITSTTGTSAILIDGTTLHSYLGIGLGTSNVGTLYTTIKNNSFRLKKWIDVDILVIDEISMLSPTLFDKLETLARSFRENTEPFGGIQLILSGDFLQLPVVGEDSFCFEAESWNKCVDEIVYLNENFRQDDDIFKKCLNEIRIGELSNETIDILKSRVNVKLENEYGILPTKIYSLNRDVEEENNTQIDKLVEKNENLEFYQYDMDYEILKKGVKNIEEKLNKACNTPFILQLCIGAQVMLLYNMDLENKLVNGSRGVVVDFENDLPRVKFLNGLIKTIDNQEWTLEENGDIILKWRQIPLKVAFAISAHKSQGVTIDYAEVDLKNIFENAQAYVALSRVRKLDGLSIKNFNKLCIKAHPKAIAFYKNLI